MPRKHELLDMLGQVGVAGRGLLLLEVRGPQALNTIIQYYDLLPEPLSQLPYAGTVDRDAPLFHAGEQRTEGARVRAVCIPQALASQLGGQLRRYRLEHDHVSHAVKFGVRACEVLPGLHLGPPPLSDGLQVSGQIWLQSMVHPQAVIAGATTAGASLADARPLKPPP